MIVKTLYWRLLALVMAFSMVAAACGSDSSDTGSVGSADAESVEAADSEEAMSEEASADAMSEEEMSEEASADAMSEEASSDAMADGAPEKTELNLGLIPIADVAPIFIAIERGFFEEEGLTVTTEFAAGGAAAIPALQSGDIDFAFGGYPSTYKAIEAGIELVITQEAVRGADLFAGFYALPDSGIAGPADMAGKTIAVNTLNNIVQLALEIQLQEAGLELSDVSLVEIPFPEQVAALELGNVDVISVVEPFGTIARASLDAVLIVDMFSGPLDGFPVAGWQVTKEFAEANPNTIAAFNRAFVKATDIAVNEEGALAAIVPTYTSASAELAATLNYPYMVSGLDSGVLQDVIDRMVEQGLLSGTMNAADHVVGG